MTLDDSSLSSLIQRNVSFLSMRSVGLAHFSQVLRLLSSLGRGFLRGRHTLLFPLWTPCQHVCMRAPPGSRTWELVCRHGFRGTMRQEIRPHRWRCPHPLAGHERIAMAGVDRPLPYVAIPSPTETQNAVGGRLSAAEVRVRCPWEEPPASCSQSASKLTEDPCSWMEGPSPADDLAYSMPSTPGRWIPQRVRWVYMYKLQSKPH